MLKEQPHNAPNSIPELELHPHVVSEVIAAKHVTRPFEKFRGVAAPTLFQMTSDILSIGVSFIVFYFWKLTSQLAHPLVQSPEFFFTVLVVSNLYWILVFWLSGLYKNWYLRSPFDEFYTVIRSVLIGASPVLFFMAMEQGTIPYKLLLYMCILIGLVCVLRFVVRKIQRTLRIRGIISLRTVIIGGLEKTTSMYNEIQKEPSWGYQVSGVIFHSMNEGKQWKYSAPVVGVMNHAEEVFKVMKPSVVILAMDSSEHGTMIELCSKATALGISVKIVPDLYEIVTGQVKALQVHGSPLIEVNPQLMKPWEEATKRVFDVLFSSLVLLLGSPFWLLIALIIKLESKGPALYSQMRVGKHGVPFKIYKFRSMVQDSEKAGQQWTKVGDPRVTRFGRIIRKTHLDEIPQMWNILIGEMSVVGPRPEQPKFVEKFGNELPYYHRRHIVRPGLTGWWQVMYTEYHESIDEIINRLRYDFYYIENMSLRLDIEIIIRTVFRVIKGHGQT